MLASLLHPGEAGLVLNLAERGSDATNLFTELIPQGHVSFCGSDTGCKGREGNNSAEPKQLVPQHRPQCPPQPLQPQQAGEGRPLSRTV